MAYLLSVLLLLLLCAATQVTAQSEGPVDSSQRCSPDDLTVLFAGDFHFLDEGGLEQGNVPAVSGACVQCMEAGGYGAGHMACYNESLPAADHCAVFGAQQAPSAVGPPDLGCRHNCQRQGGTWALECQDFCVQYTVAQGQDGCGANSVYFDVGDCVDGCPGCLRNDCEFPALGFAETRSECENEGGTWVEEDLHRAGCDMIIQMGNMMLYQMLGSDGGPPENVRPAVAAAEWVSRYGSTCCSGLEFGADATTATGSAFVSTLVCNDADVVVWNEFMSCRSSGDADTCEVSMLTNLHGECLSCLLHYDRANIGVEGYSGPPNIAESGCHQAAPAADACVLQADAGASHSCIRTESGCIVNQPDLLSSLGPPWTRQLAERVFTCTCDGCSH